mmetsp:Transcript_51927/g.111003  ORF Transcript_51927/g.111003 Transcript_51927/m.111003 type:complete len:268 (+) Transcript_51927:79-882(+)
MEMRFSVPADQDGLIEEATPSSDSQSSKVCIQDPRMARTASPHNSCTGESSSSCSRAPFAFGGQGRVCDFRQSGMLSGEHRSQCAQRAQWSQGPASPQGRARKKYRGDAKVPEFITGHHFMLTLPIEKQQNSCRVARDATAADSLSPRKMWQTGLRQRSFWNLKKSPTSSCSPSCRSRSQCQSLDIDEVLLYTNMEAYSKRKRWKEMASNLSELYLLYHIARRTRPPQVRDDSEEDRQSRKACNMALLGRAITPQVVARIAGFFNTM